MVEIHLITADKPNCFSDTNNLYVLRMAQLAINMLIYHLFRDRCGSLGSPHPARTAKERRPAEAAEMLGVF